MEGNSNYINPDQAVSLAGLFEERVQRTPDGTAYRYFDKNVQKWNSFSWHDMQQHIGRWRAALAREDINPGDRVALMAPNSPQWVMFDQAALGLGLIVVPLYVNDRADNVAYILRDAGVKILLIDGVEHWQALQTVHDQLGELVRIVSLQKIESENLDSRVRWVNDWLVETENSPKFIEAQLDDLATIVYTSGTTGRPKGVMLSHRNVMSNAYGVLEVIRAYEDDVFLSLLPLSHMFERTVGYYLAIMAGSQTAYTRSVQLLSEDLQLVKPTIFLCVPRIYEKAYDKIMAKLEGNAFKQYLFNMAVEIGWQRFLYLQGRGKKHLRFLLWPLLDKLVARKILESLGGRIRIASSGAAPLEQEIAKVFMGLGLPISQGYGLTEASPVVCCNPLNDNDPTSVGVPVSELEVKLGNNDELLVKGPSIMLGYWNNPEKTRETIDAEGWLHTGDQARIQQQHIYITGRLKDIIVMANGEKISPAGIESAIELDPLIEQVFVVGDNRPYIAAVCVLNQEQWTKLAKSLGVAPTDVSSLENTKVCNAVLTRITDNMTEFPGYVKVRRVKLLLDPWTIENGLLTPTLKLRRNKLVELYANEIEKMFPASGQ